MYWVTGVQTCDHSTLLSPRTLSENNQTDYTYTYIYIYEATALLLEQETVFTIKNSNVHIETPHKTNVLISGAVIIQTGRT